MGDVPGLYFQHAPVKHSLCAGETAESVPPTCSGNASRIHIGDISPERSRYVAAMCAIQVSHRTDVFDTLEISRCNVSIMFLVCVRDTNDSSHMCP